MKLALAQALVEGNSELSWHLPIAVCVRAIKWQMSLVCKVFPFFLFDHFNTEAQKRLIHYCCIRIYILSY